MVCFTAHYTTVSSAVRLAVRCGGLSMRNGTLLQVASHVSLALHRGHSLAWFIRTASTFHGFYGFYESNGLNGFEANHIS